jgi:hypothetical protein
MRQRLAGLLLLLLAGCGSNSPDDSPDAVCRRQAYDDPTVKDLTIGSTNWVQQNPLKGQSQFEYNQALRDATDACLRQKGIQVRGGVEPVRPR